MSEHQEVPFEGLPPITQEQLRFYAVASGDSNPIHLDESVAKAHGLPGVIAHGMLSMAFLSERGLRFVKTLPEKDWDLSSLQTRFKNMTFVGDTINVGGQVREKTAETFSLDLKCQNQRGEVTATAVMTFTRKQA